MDVPRTTSAHAAVQSKMVPTIASFSRIVFISETWQTTSLQYDDELLYGRCLQVSRPPDLLQHLRINISAANNGYIDGCSWQCILMEHEAGHCYSTAGLGHGPRIRRQPPHGLPDFGLADGHNVVDVLPDMCECDHPYALGTQSVGNRTRGLLRTGLDDFPGSETGLRVRRQFGLNPDDFCARLAQLDCRRHAADHTSSTYRHQDGLHFRQIFEDLKSHGALAGDDFLIVEWRHNHITMPRG